MREPFLILHKVRGEPAYDIAIKIPCPICEPIRQGLDTSYPGDCCEGEGFWWIIPTSGHRAYPIWSWNLRYLFDEGLHAAVYPIDTTFPDSWPDHYAVNSTKAKIEPSFLRKLISKAQTVTGTRRV